MPKAKARKESSFETKPTKSVFLYGEPNQGKLARLLEAEKLFLCLVNDDIQHLNNEQEIILQLVKNDHKSPEMRLLEKSMRQPGINSAFCQNAFDSAVTHLSNRLNDIRLQLLSEDCGIFALSKVLFAMSISGNTQSEMIQAMESIEGAFYQECAEKIKKMSESEFEALQCVFRDRYAMTSLEYRVPELKSVSVPLDSRLMKIEPSTDTCMPYVISISDPTRRNKPIVIPLNTSKHSLHKINSNKMAGTVTMRIRKNKLQISWAYSVRREERKTSLIVGVDTGIIDALHTSAGKVYGSMNETLDFYQNIVEPSFGQISSLRNKMKSIHHYLKSHNLPEDVRRSLIRKMDNLEHMIQTANAPYRKLRHYYGMLDESIASTVKSYIKDMRPGTLTVLEKLDIKEFNKSRKLNGRMSTFARGKLQKKLMESLNWKGVSFAEVMPDYTSQLCPVCSHIDSANRNGKKFLCTSCGHEDDADNNASINIRDRISDKEVLEICTKYQYSTKSRQEKLKELYAVRHKEYTAKTAVVKAESV